MSSIDKIQPEPELLKKLVGTLFNFRECALPITANVSSVRGVLSQCEKEDTHCLRFSSDVSSSQFEKESNHCLRFCKPDIETIATK